MSQSDDGDDPGALRKAYRTVTPPYLPRPNAEMDTIGWGILLGMIVLFVPLLPLFVLVWLIGKLADVAAGVVGSEPEAETE